MQIKVNPSVSLEKIKTDAKDMFANQGLTCSEAVVAAIKANVCPNMPNEVISAATGFSGGVGGSKCMCGAISGAALCLGYLFGRFHPTTPTDPKSLKTLSVAHQMQESFKKDHKVLCCHVHQRAAEKAGIDKKTQCVEFVAQAAATTASIIAKELSLATIN